MNLAVYRTISGIACSLLMAACAGGYRAMPSEVYDDPSATVFQDLPAILAQFLQRPVADSVEQCV